MKLDMKRPITFTKIDIRIPTLSVLLFAGVAACGQETIITTIAIMPSMPPRLAISSGIGLTNQIQYTTRLVRSNSWTVLTNLVVTNIPYWYVDAGAPPDAARFYRVIVPAAASNMVLIAAGSFQMGDPFQEGYSSERPVHTVSVSAFYMEKYDVTKALWDDVYGWATNHGYSFDSGAVAAAANYPAYGMTWYDAVKWCNAWSEKEGRVPAYYTNAARTAQSVYRSRQLDLASDWVNWSAGYRLPTEAEWEKAARGGASGWRFPWGNTISWSQANYDAAPLLYAYDVNSTNGYHPAFHGGASPSGYFAPNGYGLYDMGGNVWEVCVR